MTCAPSIAKLGIDLLRDTGLTLNKKEHGSGGRQVIRFKKFPQPVREEFVRDNPLYGRVICRCEKMIEGEIVTAMEREIPPVSLDRVKRRTGAGLGHCQGSFCGPWVLEILSRELCRDPLLIEEDGEENVITRGAVNVKTECLLLAFGFNINKLHHRIQNGRLVLALFPLEKGG